MRNLATAAILLTVATACAGPASFLTQQARDWNFIRSVGGMSVNATEDTLLIRCDVSGLEEVTIKPTTVNSALGVAKVKLKRDGDTIYLTVVTTLIGKGITTSPKPIDLSAYPDGTYSVQYLDPDGKKHAVGEITLD